jgi:hypothetical protein
MIKYRVRFRPVREFRDIAFEAQDDDYAKLIAWNDYRRPADADRTMLISRLINAVWTDVAKWTPKAKHWVHPHLVGKGRGGGFRLFNKSLTFDQMPNEVESPDGL